MAEANTSGGAPSVDPISGAVTAATQIASTISQIVGENKQQGFMQALQSLDQRQQMELAEKLGQANTNAQKLQILSSSLTQYLIANDAQAKKNNVLLLAIAGVIGVGLLVVVAIVVKSKS